MPNRILRPGINDSERVNLLDWPQECFYRRLISEVDDFGLFDARPSKLRGTLFSLRLDRVREADISRWSAACAKAGLFVLFEAQSQPYLLLLGLRDGRATTTKYPFPTSADFENSIALADASIRERMRADVAYSYANAPTTAPPSTHAGAKARGGRNKFSGKAESPPNGKPMAGAMAKAKAQIESAKAAKEKNHHESE